jgi:alkylation response protein AidB-like acyl-CoA dehydrogenase
VAYLVGDVNQGFRQMMEQVNLSRLSHGVRAASMMRRCLNEAMVVAQNRRAFGRAIGEYPLLRRQLMKIMLPTEQALSMYAFSADTMGKANAGDEQAANLLRILTPVYKFRACRDNIPVASHAWCATPRSARYGRALPTSMRWTWCSAPSARVAATRR